MSEGRKKVPIDELLKEWDDTLEENRRVMEPILGKVAVKVDGHWTVAINVDSNDVL